MRFCLPSAVLLATIASGGAAAQASQGPMPAYRVSSGSIRVALLPVRCARDIQPELCGALDESLSVGLSRDPRLDILSPHDLEVLMGAQELISLQSCEGDSCFQEGAFEQVGAAYLIAVVVGRIGSDALITSRLVDMQRGIVIDRDDARVSRANEGAIDEATRDLVHSLLARRGIGTPIRLGDDDEGVSGVFIAGGAMTTLGALGLAAAGVVGGVALFQASTLERSSSLDKTTFDQGAAEARSLALGADIGAVAGGTLIVAGAAMMIAGSF